MTDPDGDTLTLTVSVAQGTLTPSQAILDAVAAHTLTAIDFSGGDGSLSVSGSASAITAAIQAGVTYAPDSDFNGSDALDVEVTDGLATASALLPLASRQWNDPPTVANAIADQNAAQGSPFLFAFAANTFNDVDVGDTLTYTATLDTNAPLPAWLSFDAATQRSPALPALSARFR